MSMVPFDVLRRPWSRHALQVLLLGALIAVKPLSAIPPDPPPAAPAVGILYNLYQCAGMPEPQPPRNWPAPGSPYSPVNPAIYDTTKVLAGQACYFPAGQPPDNCWGHRTGFHWWGEPTIGYYCPSDPNTPEVFTTHAQQLAAAGVDFVVVNFSEAHYWDAQHTQASGYPDNEHKMDEPAYVRMLQYWPADGPKIVPLILATGASSVEWPWTTGERLALDKLFLDFRNKKLWYTYEGKPLVLVVANDHPDVRPDPGRIAWLESTNSYTFDLLTGTAGFTVRKMWARFEFMEAATKAANPDYASWWSYSEQCQQGFKAHHGDVLCDQLVATRNGQVEQVSLTASYGACMRDGNGGFVPYSCWASDTDTPGYTGTAVPKWGGKTFFSQFHTVSRYPTTKVVIISGWNGWINQRACRDGMACAQQAILGPYGGLFAQPFLPNGNAVFFDEYDAQHNSTFEPGGPQGNLHYKFLMSALKTLKPADFTGNWGYFTFGQPHDIPFIAQLTPTGPYKPVVFRGDGPLAYWYIDNAVDAQGFFGSWTPDPAMTTPIQFGLGKDANGQPQDDPKIVYLQSDQQYHLAVYRRANQTTYVNMTNGNWTAATTCVLHADGSCTVTP